MSATAERLGRRGDHVVQLYAADPDLADTAGGRLVDALSSGACAIVIATESHLRAFEQRLAAGGIDVEAARRNGRLTTVDAAETLQRFTRDGGVDVAAIVDDFEQQLHGLPSTGRPTWIFGEMVALLWDAGDVPAAIELERRWEALTVRLGCSVFCAYPATTVSAPAHGEAFERMCALHSHVLPSGTAWDLEPRAAAAAEARDRLTAVLRGAGHDGELLDDARVVLTELVANAVVHARSACTVRIDAGDTLVRIEVHDASPQLPTLREAHASDASGRGLRLVDALARRWGVDPRPDGKLVWAELEP